MITDTFADTNILVIGDVMLDRYVWGDVRRISPEAPVPVLKMRRTTETLGGAGNVANNLAGLGCQVTLIGVCGNDAAGDCLQAVLRDKNISDGLVRIQRRPSTTKTRIMARKQQVLRLDEEQVGKIPADIAEDLVSRIVTALHGCDVVILSDYGKGLLASLNDVQQIIDMCRDRRIPVLVDPKGVDWERYRRATCVTPNTSELEALVGRPLAHNEDLLVASAEATRVRHDLQWLLVTRGERGMCLLGSDGPPVTIAAKAREVYDVSGAGDTVIATLGAALAAGASFGKAAETANLAAGVVVGKLGTQPIQRAELAACLQFDTGSRNYPHTAAKMTAIEGALVKVSEWRTARETIVFTNGCFDLLHPGHISLLHQASALGDRLIVGLNTDASVRRLKGDERPILNEQDRGAILSALESVDLVVLFDEDTPLQLIEALRPDILVKGSDYQPHEVVGKSEVESYGGRVALVDLVKGYSTTDITRKVRSCSTQ